jgi:hypothetical protein
MMTIVVTVVVGGAGPARRERRPPSGDEKPPASAPRQMRAAEYNPSISLVIWPARTWPHEPAALMGPGERIHSHAAGRLAKAVGALINSVVGLNYRAPLLAPPLCERPRERTTGTNINCAHSLGSRVALALDCGRPVASWAESLWRQSGGLPFFWLNRRARAPPAAALKQRAPSPPLGHTRMAPSKQ